MSPTSFLDLSAELRNEIYQLALVDFDDFKPIRLPTFPKKRSRNKTPDFLLACRQIRDEATPVYYGCNIFETEYYGVAKRFLRALRGQSIASIRFLRPFASLAFATSLQRHNTMLEMLRTSTNELGKASGRGLLKVEAIFLPGRMTPENIEYRPATQVECLRVQRLEGGQWQLEVRMKEGETGFMRYATSRKKFGAL